MSVCRHSYTLTRSIGPHESQHRYYHHVLLILGVECVMTYSFILTGLIASQAILLEAVAVDFSIPAAAPSDAPVLDYSSVGLS